MKNTPYPVNDFIRKIVGKKTFLTCEIYNKSFQQSFLIKHIEHCHIDEEISDSFRKKLFDLTLSLQRKTRTKSTFYGNNSSNQVTGEGLSNVLSESSDFKPSTNDNITWKSKQFSDLTFDKKFDGYNRTKSQLHKITENKTDRIEKLSLKKVFRKIDKNCTAQAVKTSKKKYFLCKLCGVLIENYKMKEHVLFHNTGRGKVLFSPENLQECEKCGRVLRKGMFQKHVCLILTANDKAETETNIHPTEIAYSSKKPRQKKVSAEVLVSKKQTHPAGNNSKVEMLSRHKSKVIGAIVCGIDMTLTELSYNKLAYSLTDEGRSCASGSDKGENIMM